MKKFKKFSFLFLLFPVLWLSGSYAGSVFSTRATPAPIGENHQYFNQKVIDLELKSKDDTRISAWYIEQADKKKAVILMSGLHGNRLSMVKRAKLYLEKDYTVLLPDLRGTGNSDEELITFGWNERWDLHASYDFLKMKGYTDIAVHGQSLGAATIAYSFQESPDYKFVVLESCYDNIDQALANRVERFHLPMFLFKPLYFFTEYRIDATTKDLSPEDYLHLCKAPTLFIAGDSEIRVRKNETEKLFTKCSAQKKELYFFKGAKHIDFLKYDSKEYSKVLNDWLNQVE